MYSLVSVFTHMCNGIFRGGEDGGGRCSCTKVSWGVQGRHASPAQGLFLCSASHRLWLASGSSVITSTRSHSAVRLDFLMASTTVCT